MKRTSSLHIAAMLALTICSGVAFGAGCVAQQEDDTRAPEGPADTGDEDVESSEDALTTQLSSSWIGASSPTSTWRKWHSTVTWNSDTRTMTTVAHGYACERSATCAAGVRFVAKYVDSSDTITIEMPDGSSLSYRGTTELRNTLSSSEKSSVRAYLMAIENHRVSTVGSGRRLSALGCTGAALQATGGWILALGACGAGIVAGSVTLGLATVGCAGEMLIASGVTADAVDACVH